MKKVVKKLNQALSVLLAAAMVVGSAPDVSLVVHAEEESSETAVVEAITETADDDDAFNETASDGTSADETSAETETPVQDEKPTESEQDEDTQPEASTVAETTEESAEGNTAGGGGDN